MAELQEAALRIAQRLTLLYASQRKGVPTARFGIARMTLTPRRRYGTVEMALPPKVKMRDLKSKGTLEELSIATGRRVGLAQLPGIVYVVDLEGRPAGGGTLPEHVSFALDSYPPGEEFMVPLGVGEAGWLWISLLEQPNILCGGVTGAGKSTLLHNILCALVAVYPPEKLQLALIDPKGVGVELGFYEGLPHLIAPVAHELESAKEILERVRMMFDDRSAQFRAAGVRSWDAYIRQTGEDVPFLVLVVDELLDLAALESPRSLASSPFQKDLIRLASMARALGGNVILSATMPKADVINTALRANCTVRVCLRVMDKSVAKMILGARPVQIPPAEPPGRALAYIGGELRWLQIPEISSQQIRAIAGRAGADSQLLSPQMLEVLDVAIKQLGGAFKVETIYDVLGGPMTGGPMSYDALKALARKWEFRGWLTPNPSATEPRRVTPRLRGMWEEARGIGNGYTPSSEVARRASVPLETSEGGTADGDKWPYWSEMEAVYTGKELAQLERTGRLERCTRLGELFRSVRARTKKGCLGFLTVLGRGGRYE